MKNLIDAAVDTGNFKMLVSAFKSPGELKPMEGRPLRASLHGSAIHINGATIVQSDIRATNGVIHAIDDVLLPLNPILAAVA